MIMWPDPLKIIDDAIASATQPKGHEITWYYQTGASGAEIEQFLRSYGVRVWGRTYEQEEGEMTWYGLHVRESQALWACSLLLNLGVPVRSGLVEGAKAMSTLPRSSWDSIAPAVGLGGVISEFFMGRPRAKNTRSRRRRGRR